MIFMSQSGLTDRAREAEWDQWYVEHLRIMRTVDGIASAQRFRTRDAGWPHSLAMYSIRSADVFDDAYYQSVRGMGEWLPLIDRRQYRRNLFEGLEYAPEVFPGQVLWVADRASPDLELSGCRFSWLRAVGLDRTTPFRGIAVVPAKADAGEAGRAGVAVYEAIIG